MPVPFVIYADFEAITKKVQGCEQSEEMEKENKKKYSKPNQTYRGESAVYKFMERMLEEVEYYKGVVKKRFNKPLVMTENDEMCFKLMDKCHICDKKYAL